MVSPTTGDIVTTHSWVRPGFPPFGERILKGLLPWIEARIREGQLVSLETIEDFPPEALNERKYAESSGIKSGILAPFRVGGKVIGAMGIDHFRKHVHWDPYILLRVGDIADIFANAMARKQADEVLQHAFSTIERLKEQLEQENSYLRQEIQVEHSHSEVVGNSAAIRGVLKKAEQVAATDSLVLILGETGTGKELIARTIHEMSGRKNRAMVKVNCAALPATLIESELFGRERGAFTGALSRQIGRFELADQSTIFLDEIGELPPEVQVKLLRVLQEGEFERLGSPKTIRVNVRVIAATSRNLQAMVRDGKFREDLYYRLNVFPILIPPLRERAEDIPALVWHILKDLGKRMGRNIESVRATTLRQFQQYPWPGNVREMRNVIERNLILTSGTVFRAEVPELEQYANLSLRRVDEVETEHFRKVLQATHWRVRGRGGAAELLGLKPTTLEARMRKFGIHRPA
jgi:transcriptional regulator with GAF, ATPase, and Fis domain